MDSLLPWNFCRHSRNFPGCVLHKLKRIKMNPLCGNVLQMEFLKFLLANAHMVETVSITIAREAKVEEAMILWSLISFHRASASLNNFTVDISTFTGHLTLHCKNFQTFGLCEFLQVVGWSSSTLHFVLFMNTMVIFNVIFLK